MKAGFAHASITPALGATMMGFGSRDMAHGCTEIHDDIYARALYLEQREQRALIIGFDLCFLGRADADRLKGLLGARLGLTPAQILLNTSHSHVGPKVGTWYSAGYEPPDEAYLKLLDKATLQAAVEARNSAREVTLATGATRSRLPMNRRGRNAQGAVEMLPNPGGPTCDTLPLTLFRDASGRPVCLLFSVSCHPSMMTGWEISGEYPGAAVRKLDAHLGATCSLFLEGTGGDAKPCVIGDGERWRGGTWEEMDQAGQIVADEVIAALPDLQSVQPSLACALAETQWPMDPPLDAAGYAAVAADAGAPEIRRKWAQRMGEQLAAGTLPASVPILVQAIQVAHGVRLVGIEGEAVHSWGRFMERFYDGGVTFPLGYCNGEGLYLPTSDMMDEGGYEVVSNWEYGWPAQLAKGYENILSATLASFREEGVE